MVQARRCDPSVTCFPTPPVPRSAASPPESATLAHELRTPLASLALAVDALQAHLDQLEPTEARALLERMRRSLTLLNALADSLTVSAQIQMGRLQLIFDVENLRECLETALAVVQPIVELRHQRIKVDCPPYCSVRAAKARIEQVLVNLLINASKYGDPATEIHLSVLRVGVWARVQIDNVGPGISHLEQDQIFDPYVRGQSVIHPATPGTGLGLYIAKALVEAHGGQIGVTSAPNDGTSFWFTLPMAR